MSKESGAWVCSACRSINAKRTSTCYRCRAPRELAGATADTLPTVGGMVQPAALHPYRSAHLRAVVTVLAMVVAFGATTVLALWLFPETIASELSASVRASVPDPLTLWSAWAGAIAIVMLAWAAWISRIVDNEPALGLGYPRVTPRWAVVESLIPGPNLISALARIREALVKLDPKGHGVGFINLAWLLAFAPWGVLALYIRVARWVVGYGELGREFRIILPALWFGSFGGVLLVALAIARVEVLSAARDRALRAAPNTPGLGEPRPAR